ncbi:arylsulfatase [Paenibacillus aceris]|uniref:Choline-sulfatase n=1 Tax=Paenibacillus aceris TaxID=869555 RepID=A0ABS4HXF1_9BACL|nr:arylsulfatase [Paenibacillus aceris]MBP1963346.1 choline-sulfatase [Paenibacillus aceris]NHW36147.1 arylsulfatase [Paenibacillus aceris]
MTKPNVLLIMTDQQRWDTLGCYGNMAIETPNLDWLASMGTVFRAAYTPSPSCVPARASLISGMDPWNTGILGMGGGQGNMGVGFSHTLPGELAQAGYHTQGVGKMHFYPQRALNGFHRTVLDESGRVYDPGFVSDYKQWFDRNKTGDYDITDHGIDWNSWMARPYHAPEFLHPSVWTVNESIKFLKERDPSKPFFMKTSFARPHSPYDPPSYYFDMYMKKELPEPCVGDWAAVHDVPEDAAAPHAWRGVRSREEIMRARAGYYGSINFIDHQIGRLLIYLQNNRLLDQTLIIFTSDHGDMLGDHNLWRKTYAYEGSAHIPLIVRLPKSCGKPIAEVAEPVTLQDIMPTILEATGVSIPETVDGRSLLGLMRGESNEWREYVHGEHSTCYSEVQEMQYLTDGKMKYIWLPRAEEEQLFHLGSDPYECIDLARMPEHREELLKWRARMVKVLEQRNAGLTEGEQLVSLSGKPFLVSPKYEERIRGTL